MNSIAKPIRLFFVLSCACLFACSDDGAPDPSPEDASARAGASAPPEDPTPDAPSDPTASTDSSCARGTLEPDFQPMPLSGPNVHEGKLAAGDYVISTTYLQLRQDPQAQMRFGQLMQPILADLATRPGLLAVSLGTAPMCGIARTLSVWRDEAAMFDFVLSSAHSAAMASVGEVSRGGSLVTHWSGDAAAATWEAAAERAGAEEGPLY
jgi:hypothetical protein